MIYVSQTYMCVQPNQCSPPRYETFESIEVVSAIFFGLDWLLMVFLADQRWSHTFSFYPMIDRLSTKGREGACAFARRALVGIDKGTGA